MLGDLVVVDHLLRLEVEDPEVFVLPNGEHVVAGGVDVGAHHCLCVHLVLAQLRVLHRGLDVDLDGHDGSVLTAYDEVVQSPVPGEGGGGAFEGPAPDLLVVLFLALGVLEHPGL